MKKLKPKQQISPEEPVPANFSEVSPELSRIMNRTVRDSVVKGRVGDCITKGRLRGGRGEWVWRNAA